MTRPASRELPHGERSRLLPRKPITDNSTSHTTQPTLHTYIVPGEYVCRVLVLAFSASVAMAATAASTVFAYAVILCQEPAHCRGEERGAFAGTVALAATIANVSGIIALGPLQRAVQLNAKNGLLFWLISRGMSVAMLALAVSWPSILALAKQETDFSLRSPLVWCKSILVAILARVFEGLATDNLLHYALSAIYVSTTDTSHSFSRLMGYSLALFMMGMSVSPIIAGLLPGFFSSFFVALSMFAFSLFYVQFFVPLVRVEASTTQAFSAPGALPHSSEGAQAWKFGMLQVFRPFIAMYQDIHVGICGVALLLFNITQAYLFPSMMVYASTKFSFTNTQNGYLVSIAATVSALDLLMVHYLKPKLDKYRQQTENFDDSTQTEATSSLETGSSDDRADSGSAIDKGESTKLADFVHAVLSLSAQIVALPSITLAWTAWQMYALVSVVALGLAAPSSVKSYAVYIAEDKAAAVASLAMMEMIGGLLSAMVLGTLQAWTGGGGTVFLVASGIVGGSLLALIASHFVRRARM